MQVREEATDGEQDPGEHHEEALRSVQVLAQDISVLGPIPWETHGCSSVCSLAVSQSPARQCESSSSQLLHAGTANKQPQPAVCQTG